VTTAHPPIAAAGLAPADSAFSEPFVDDLERYVLYARTEILANLRILVDHHAVATIYFNRGADALVSRIVGINPKFDEMHLERAPDHQTGEKMQAAHDLTVVSNFNDIKVQFTVGRAGLTLYRGTPAYRVRLPQSILRLQRRTAFRAPTPLENSPDVLLPPIPDDSGETSAARLRITDISATGFSFVAPTGRPILRTGMQLPGCLIRLVANESFSVDIEIRRVSVFDDGFGQEVCQAGCHLLRLSCTAEMAIQRYVYRLDVARRNNP
jgi:c-di-GMP-binding flagellar brake protein YcgR